MVFIKRINGVVVEDKDLSNITLSNKVITEIIRDVNARIEVSTKDEAAQNELKPIC